MKLSQFTRQLKPSETLAISTKAKALRAQGRNIIDFGLGEPDFATPSNIIRAAEHAMGNLPGRVSQQRHLYLSRATVDSQALQ